MDIPKDLLGNLRARQVLLAKARESREMRESLWILAARDVVAFVNLFCFTYDPRLVKEDRDPVIPWITWPYQDEALRRIDGAIGKHPLLIEKSRDMGATWMLMAVFTHQWLFRKNRSFLLASRTEDLVDSRGNTDSLFWKIDFLIQHLPEWMKPTLERTALHLANRDRANVIDGSSTNDDLGRGGRRTAVGYDEFPAVDKAHEVHSASSSLTECPIYMGTHKGVGTKFYELTKSEMPRLRLHWTLHPKKAAGLYRDKFGNDRSPWYDSLSTVFGMTKQQIASEVDIDPEGSDFNYFDGQEMMRLERELVRPGIRGVLSVNEDEAKPGDWADTEKGDFFLWGPLVLGRPPADRLYVVGVDISAGTGSSNSVIFVGDVETGEQVMEYAVPNILPQRLASIAVAVCRWYMGHDGRGAHLIWDSTGPGGAVFGQTVVALGYRNLYYKEKVDTLDTGTSLSYGFGMHPRNKEVMFAAMKGDLYGGRFKPRSEWFFSECRGYNFKDGRIEYTASRQSGDPSNAGAAHGDRVIAAGLAWYRMRWFAGIVQGNDRKPVEKAIPIGSLAWRMQEVERDRMATADEW